MDKSKPKLDPHISGMGPYSFHAASMKTVRELVFCPPPPTKELALVPRSVGRLLMANARAHASKCCPVGTSAKVSVHSALLSMYTNCAPSRQKSSISAAISCWFLYTPMEECMKCSIGYTENQCHLGARSLGNFCVFGGIVTGGVGLSLEVKNAGEAKIVSPPAPN